MTFAGKIVGSIVLVLAVSCSPPGDTHRPVVASEPLPSWNDGDARNRILEFVERVTDPASADFVPEPERIATFDNDGTLWSEKPAYFQLLFAMDRIRDVGSRASRMERRASRSRVCWKATWKRWLPPGSTVSSSW